jgi:hypothetical protein
VRLCNPCVPDPNIAPPQTASLESQQQGSSHRILHNRSTSLATPYYTPSQPPTASARSNEPLLNASNFARRPRETSITGNNLQPPSSLQNDHLLSAASSQGGRSRASTVRSIPPFSIYLVFHTNSIRAEVITLAQRGTRDPVCLPYNLDHILPTGPLCLVMKGQLPGPFLPHRESRKKMSARFATGNSPPAHSPTRRH